MSPFYFKEGESWKKLEGVSVDIKVGGTNVTLIPKAEDKEQVAVYTERPVVGLVEDHDVIFPGEMPTVNRRGISFKNLQNGARETLIHSEEPIELEH